MIAVDDIGRFGARALTDAATLNRREIDLAGDVRTMPEAAGILTEAPVDLMFSMVTASGGRCSWLRRLRDYAQSPHAVTDGQSWQPNRHNPRSHRKIATVCGAGSVGGFALAVVAREMSTATRDSSALPTAASTLDRSIFLATLRSVGVVVVLAAVALTHTAHLGAYGFAQGEMNEVHAVATPAAAPQTREEIAAEQRRARGQDLQPTEPGFVERTMLTLSNDRLMDRLFDPRHGFFVRVGLPVEGASFAAGPAWRASDAGRHYTFTASLVGSISREWLGELAVQIPDALPRLGRDRFFANVSISRSGRVSNEFWGLGNSSSKDDTTVFRLTQTVVGGTFGARLTPWLSVAGTAARLTPEIKRSESSTRATTKAFDESTAPGLVGQPTFFRPGITVDLDYRDSLPPTRTAVRLDPLPVAAASHGGRYQVNFASYHDRDFDQYSFRKTTIDLQQFVPLLHGYRVLAFRALAVLSDTSDGQVMPFYLSPTYGGLNVGRGYPTFRFRDRNLLALQAEYRYQLNGLVSAAVFVDSGQVAPRVGAIAWSQFKTTYGTGVRFGASGGAALRFDLAFGGDGPTFIFGLGHAF